MKGKNELRVNEATLIEAMQEYLNARWRDGEAPKVVAVHAAATSSTYESPMWAIELEDGPAP